MSEALTPTQVAEVFLNQGVSGVGAGAGTVVLLTDTHMLEIIGAIGYASELSKQWQQFSVDLPVPLHQLHKDGRVDDARLETALQHIDIQSVKLNDLIVKLLDISRLEAGRLILEFSSTDLVTLVNDVTQTLQRTTGRHTLTLTSPAALTITDHARFIIHLPIRNLNPKNGE